MGRRQPEVKRKQRRLRQQPDGHQCRGGDDRRHRPDAFGQQRDIEGAVGTVEQDGAEHIQHRAEQGEQQVAQRGLQGFGAAFETDQGHPGEGQEFERDIQRKQIAGQEYRVERPPDRQQQRPEHERRTHLMPVLRHLEIAVRKQRYSQQNHRRRQQHDHRQAVGAQGNAERRRPATQQIDQRVAGLHQFDANCDGQCESGRNCQHDHPPGVAPTQGQRGENTGERQDKRQDEQETTRCRCLRDEYRQRAHASGGSAGSGDDRVAEPLAS